jgi:putative NIF3 family GTP cyclohydrolase 1 type 2
MKITDIFRYGIEAGKSGDTRDCKELEEKEKSLQNENSLYEDSAIHFDSGKEIKRVFVGIDCETAEILIAERLGVDLVLGHHPEGAALVNLWKVMDIHREALITDGVSVNVAERVVEERQEEIKRAFHGSNFNRAVDAAKLLNISFLNLHTPADNLANRAMKEFIERGRYKTIKEFIEGVSEIEEYKDAEKSGVKPKVVSGSDNNRIGKVFVKFNGGTSGNKKIFKYLESAGVSTFICMHLPETHIEEAKKHNINVIVMPHMASDSLGINLLIDEILKRGKDELEIIAGAGFVRVDRRQ